MTKQTGVSIIRILGILLTAIILGAIILGVAGCNSPKKAVAKYKASSAFPKDCADQFPPQITPGQTITTPGPSVNCDSVQEAYNAFWESMLTAVNGDLKAMQDSIAAMQARGETIPTKTVKCPDNTNRTDTAINTALTEHYRRLANEALQKAAADSTAMAAAHSKSISKLQSQLSHKSNQIKTRTRQRNVGWALLSLVGLYTFRHQLIGLLQGPIGSALSFILGLFRRKQ